MQQLDSEQRSGSVRGLDIVQRRDIVNLLRRLERLDRLDPIIVRIRDSVRHTVQPQALRDLLHGVWLGHPLHPILVQAPIGMWLSAAVIDLLPGGERQARLLIGGGVATALPAALAGYVDWSELHEDQQRVGLIHATANNAALLLYSASLLARLRGRPGKVLGFAGLGSVLFGGLLGGHLAYHQAAGANQTENVPHRLEPGWQDLCRLDELPEGVPVQRLLGAVPVLAINVNGRVSALADVCSHQAGPLHQGTLSACAPSAVGADGAGAASSIGDSDDVAAEAAGTATSAGRHAADSMCITCPWHGSTFRLSDGAVVSGPATAPVPAFEVAVGAGVVRVRMPHAG